MFPMGVAVALSCGCRNGVPPRRTENDDASKPELTLAGVDTLLQHGRTYLYLTSSDTLNERPKQLHHLLLINLIDACLIGLLKF